MMRYKNNSKQRLKLKFLYTVKIVNFFDRLETPTPSADFVDHASADSASADYADYAD